MEKSAVEGFGRFIPRLLTIIRTGILFLVTTLPVWSESGLPEPLRVLVQTEGNVLVSGSPWKLTLLVGHPKPEEVTIQVPVLPSQLILDRIRREIRGPGETKSSGGLDAESTLWTVVEYIFIPRGSGSFTIGPFEVMVPGKRSFTSPISIRIQGAEGTEPVYLPRLFWSGVLDRPQVGVPLVLELHLAGQDPSIAIQSFTKNLAVDLVQNALVEALPVTEAELASGLVYRVQFVPLQTGQLVLPMAELEWGPIKVKTAAESIMVSNGPLRKTAGPGLETQRTIPEKASSGIRGSSSGATQNRTVPPFPPLRLTFPWNLVWPMVSGSFQQKIGDIQGLWERGDVFSSLLMLRMLERDSLAGPVFRQIRQDAERQIQMLSSLDEWWTPKPLLLGITLMLVFVGFMLGIKKKIRAGILFLVLAGSVLIYSMGGQSVLEPVLRGGRLALIRETASYTIPDRVGGIGAHFLDGEAVLVKNKTEGWVFVNSTGQQSGWVPLSSIVEY